MASFATAGAETRVNTHISGDQSDQSVVALADGGWVVTWTSDGQDGDGLGRGLALVLRPERATLHPFADLPDDPSFWRHGFGSG